MKKSVFFFFFLFCCCYNSVAPQCSGKGEEIVKANNSSRNVTTCLCNPGYSGPSCENKTCTLPCKNGDCVVKDGQSSCECYEGFTGNMCENGNLDACLFHHCDNNSTCKDLDAKRYTCECNTEYVFTGVFCNETKCQKNCSSSTVCAVNGNNDEYCKCMTPGRTGERCETDIDECKIQDICHAGNCTNTNGSFYCHCPAGWSGIRCTEKIDYCANNTKCGPNGTCIIDGNRSNTSYCSCDVGFTGDSCQTLICDITPCQNNGTCQKDGTCACPLGWTGDQCTTNNNDCDGVDCGNGSCNDSLNGYTCNCQYGYKGAHCKEQIDPCSSKPCVNGGTCFNKNVTTTPAYTCACHPGFEGQNCSEVLQCSSCKHGRCTKNGCQCDAGFTGTSCTEITCPYTNCTLSGVCNELCNSPECGYGNFTCTLGLNPYNECPECADLGNNGACDAQCNNARCTFDGGECRKVKECNYERLCTDRYNDSQCDLACNNAECGFDDMSCSSKEEKLANGKLIMVVGSTPEDFKEKQSVFERSLSILLNSHVIVDKIEVVGSQQSNSARSRRAVDGQRLQVRSLLDNRECTSGCFENAREAANYIAIKKSKNQLKLPVAVYAVRSEPSQPNPNAPPIAPLWIALLVIVPLILVGMVYKGRRVFSKLWRPESTHIDPGTRMEPVGHEENELRNLKESDSPDSIHESKRIKLDVLGSSEYLSHRTMHSTVYGLHSTVPFLSNVSNVSNQNGHNNVIYENPLHHAIHMRDTNRVLELLDNTDINVRDSFGRTALQLSLVLKQAHIFDLLIRNRALNPDLQDDKGCTCLMVACEYNFNRQVEELISLGCKVTLSNKDGKTALHMAAKINNSTAANILIKHGAKVDAPDNQMRTPLYIAASEGSYETAVVLVANYANRSCRDIDDKTPLSVSRSLANQRMVLLLSDIANSPNSMVPSPNHYPSPQGSISPQPVYPDIRPKLHPMNGNRVEYPSSGPAKQSRRKRKSTPKEKKLAMVRDQYSDHSNLMIAAMPPMNNTTTDQMNNSSKESYPLLNSDMTLHHKFWEPDSCLKDMPPSWDSQVSQQQPPHQHQQHYTQAMPPTSMPQTSIVPNSFEFIDPSYPSPFDTPQSVIEELSPFSDNIPSIMESDPLTPPPSWTTSPESDYSDGVNNY